MSLLNQALTSPSGKAGAFSGLCALILFSSIPKCRAEPNSHARVELIADLSAPQPSHTLWAGLLFRLDPGWHVYWRNAGDSGEPPKIQWHLPPGFRAGAISWPTPRRLGSGSIVDYGYENQVLLMVPIEAPSVPAHSAKNGTVELAADVSYLVCREICVPGKAHPSLSLPPTGSASQDSDWTTLFRQTKAQLPKPAPSSWTIAAQLSDDRVVLSVNARTRVAKATFFPMEPGVVENSAPQDFAPAKAGFQLTLKKSDLLTKDPAELRGVLVLNGAAAYEIAAPIRSR
jgi:DsbC/DsbD-like thiol-disulfide interchange protein